MEIQEALEIVSYKLALKKGADCQSDPVLLSEVVDKALADKESGSEKQIELRSYMTATKVVNEYRKEYARKLGESWLAENAAKPGVLETESGLQYRIISEGEGDKCGAEAQVVVDYEGALIDGTVFDSTFEKGKPATFSVSGVIKGWQEGLQLMTKGSEYEFFIPQELGYGDRGSGSSVPPFATLIFKVRLIDIL